MSQHQRILETPSVGTTLGQEAVVRAIRKARSRHPWYGPSYREIADELGVTVNDVAQKVSRLLRDGRVKIDHGVARSLRVVDEK